MQDRPLGAVPPAPRSFSELAQELSRDYRPVPWPRNLLLPGELVLLAVRPVLFSRYWGRLLFFGFNVLAAALLLVAFGVWGDAPLNAVTVVVADLLIFMACLALTLLAWSRTAYVLTDRRVLTVGGLTRTDHDLARYDEIRDLVRPSSRNADLLFHVQPTPSGRIPAGPPRIVRWRSIGGAPRIYGFVQRAFVLRALQERSAAAAATREERRAAGWVDCPYCGNPVPKEALDVPDPRCARCTAPLLPGPAAG